MSPFCRRIKLFYTVFPEDREKGVKDPTSPTERFLDTKATEGLGRKEEDARMTRTSGQIVKILFVAISALAAASCAPPESNDFAADPTNGGGTSTSFSNYIIVANNTSRNVVLLDPNGTFVRTLYQDFIGTNTPFGLSMYDSENVLIGIEGTDQAQIANLRTGTSSTYIVDANLTGTIRGVARLSGGDVIVSEGTGSVERFSSGTSPTRITSGGWPVALMTTVTNMRGLSNTANYFVQCSTGTDAVRIYNTSGTQQYTATSAVPAPSLGAVYDVQGCDVGPSDQIVALYNGANDGVRVYDSTLASIVWTYQNAALLPNPRAVGFRKSTANGATAGYVLAIDNSNLMIEINTSGILSRTISTPVIAVANEMLVVP